MKNILKYLLLCCSALSLFGCEDYLDKTPQGDKTEEVFSPVSTKRNNLSTVSISTCAPADQPLVHIRYFSDSALADECEGSSAENGLVEQVQRRRLGTRCGTLLEMQRHDRRRAPATLSGLRSIRTSAVQTSFSKVSRNTTRPTRRYTPERCRSVSARSISCAPTCTTAC